MARPLRDAPLESRDLEYDGSPLSKDAIALHGEKLVAAVLEVDKAGNYIIPSNEPSFVPTIENALRCKKLSEDRIQEFLSQLCKSRAMKDRDEELRRRIYETKFAHDLCRHRQSAQASVALIVTFFNEKIKRYEYAAGSGIMVICDNGPIVFTAKHLFECEQHQQLIAIHATFNQALLNPTAARNASAIHEMIDARLLEWKLPKEININFWLNESPLHDSLVFDFAVLQLLPRESQMEMVKEHSAKFFMWPPTQQPNAASIDVMTIGYVGSPANRDIENWFTQDLSQGLKQLMGDCTEYRQLLLQIRDDIFYNKNGKVVAFGSMTRPEDGYAQVSCSTTFMLSGAPVFLVDAPQVLVGFVMGGGPKNGKTVIVTYQHPGIQAAYHQFVKRY